MTRAQIEQYIERVIAGGHVVDVQLNGHSVQGDVRREQFDTITIEQLVTSPEELRPTEEGVAHGIPYRVVTTLTES